MIVAIVPARPVAERGIEPRHGEETGMAERRRPLKTVTGVSGSVDVYTAAIDPAVSTVAYCR